MKVENQQYSEKLNIGTLPWKEGKYVGNLGEKMTCILIPTRLKVCML